MIDEVVGTFVGRWYVTGFGAAFLFSAVRNLGWRRTGIYAAAALVVGVAAENGSVHWGVPYTRYTFNPALRGDELWAFDAPLMVAMSYTFMSYFAFGAARLVVAGPRRTHTGSWRLEGAVAVLLATWALWIVDPMSRLGEHFFLGELFAYDGPGFWFGLPLGSQAGFALTSAILVGVLTWLTRDDAPAEVGTITAHPWAPALGSYLGQVLFMTGTGFWIGDEVTEANAIAGAAFVIFVPMALLVAVHWHALAQRDAVGAPFAGSARADAA